jgi:glutaredoxin 3
LEKMTDTSQDTTEITLYTTDPCPYCKQAKALLDARGYAYAEVDMARDSEAREQLVAKTGRMTFPQIMVGEKSVGGFQELLAAHRAGTLDEVLKAA